MRLTSSALKRTGTILPLASPFGSFGRPIFFGFGLVDAATFPRFLHDGSLHGGLWRSYGRDVQDCDVALRVRGIVCVVHPGINPVRLRVSLQPKHFDDSVPYRLPLERLDYRHALQMLRPSMCSELL